MNWPVGEAKQKLSEVLRRSAAEPQLIYSRDRFVAAVISAELYEELERWRAERRSRSLADSIAELREICEEDGYALEVGERGDRESWLTDAE